MAGIDSGFLMSMFTAGMNLEEIENKFKEEVSDDIWDKFIRHYKHQVEFSIDYYTKNLVRAINDMRKLGYSDVQIAFHGGFEFTNPDGSTIKLRGI